MSATAPSVAAAPAPERKASLLLVVLLIAPIALINALGFLVPVLNLARMSFYEVEPTGAMREVHTLATCSWCSRIPSTPS